MATIEQVALEKPTLSPQTNDRDRLTPLSPAGSPLLLASLSALIFFFAILPWLGFATVGGSSEARELHVAQSILRDNTWLFPSRNGLVPSKPPLFHWLVASIAGSAEKVTPFIGRSVSLLAASVMIWCTVYLCALILTRLKLPPHGALIAPFVLVYGHGFLTMAGDARVDTLYSAFVVLAITSFIAPILTETALSKRTAGAWFFWWSGCAVLTKGPLGAVLPMVVGMSVGAVLLGWRESMLRLFRPQRGWLLTLAVGTSWYGAAAAHGNFAVLERQLLFENVSRLTGGEKINTEAPWFYLGSAFWAMFPASLVFLYHGWRGLQVVRLRLPASIQLRYLGTFWFCSGLVLFSLAAGKRHSYLLPLFPGVALDVAIAVALWFQRLTAAGRQSLRSLSRLLTHGLLGLSMSLVLTVLLLHTFPIAGSAAQSVALGTLQPLFGPLLAVSGCAAIGATLLLTRFRVLALPRFSGILSVGFALLIIGASFVVLAVKNNLKNFDALARSVNEAIPAGVPLRAIRDPFDEYLDPLLYYLNRPVTLVFLKNGLDACREPGVVIARSSDAGIDSNSQAQGIQRWSQPLDAARGRLDREIVVWRCPE